ncbi:hypothetical protein MBT84_00095 [Streptomyces sp. MBT84]|nr:hypothetical protein [Streptomyces sp. MBT84]
MGHNRRWLVGSAGISLALVLAGITGSAAAATTTRGPHNSAMQSGDNCRRVAIGGDGQGECGPDLTLSTSTVSLTGGIAHQLTVTCPTTPASIPVGANLTVGGTPIAVSITSVTGNSASITPGTIPGATPVSGTLTLVCATIR